MVDNDPQSGSTSRVKSCALIALGPVLLVIVLAVVFVVNNRPPNVYIPTHKLPKDDGYDYFVRAGKMLGVIGPSSSSARLPNSWTVPELKRYVISNSPALTMLRVGLKRQHVIPAMRSLNLQFPDYFAQCRELARRLVDEGRYYRAIGSYGRAAESHLDCIEFGAAFARGGALIAGLVGIAIEAIGTHDFGQLLPKLNAHELERVARRLERIEARRVPFRAVMEEEGRSSAAELIETMSGGAIRDHFSNPVNWFRGAPMSTPSGSAGDAWNNARFAFSNKTAAVRSVMDYCNAIAAETSKPYTDKSNVPEPGNAVAQWWTPDYNRARLAWEKAAAVSAVLRAEIAVRRYGLDHNRFPDRLADLVPVYLKAVPVDPLGLGKPLRYRPLDGGKSFVLYSLGPNLKDDGGTPGRPSGAWRSGDIVAGKW